MTLEDLRVFVAACEAGSLSAAARRLERTQSAVSQHMARLEAAYGARLLERGARGVEPTEAGRILWELALQGLDALALAQQRIRALEQGEGRSLTITTGGTTVRHFLRQAVVRFRGRHPGINLRFLPAGSTRRCFELLRLNRADLALVTTDEHMAGVSIQTVATQGFFLLVAEDDPMATARSLSMGELRGIRYLGLAEGTSHRRLIDQAAAEHGFRLEPEIVFDDFDTASVFVELGLGQAIVPAVQAHNLARSAAVRAIPLNDVPPAPFGWGLRHRKYLAAVARDFLAVFDETLADLERIPGVTLGKR